jgi:hypothetical protein
MFLLDIKKSSFDWAFIYWGSPRFWIFEKIKKSEAPLLGNVTLHCQTTKVIGQRTTDNGQRTCRAGW